MDNSTSSTDQTVHVAFKLPEIPGMDLGIPPDSYFATTLLKDLLVASLNSADLFISGGYGLGPLNRSYYTFQVSNANEASKIIIGVLKKYKVHPFARIYRFDDSEKIWRCLFPEGGNAADFAAWGDEVNAAIKITEQRLERIGKILEQIPPDNAPEK